MKKIEVEWVVKPKSGLTEIKFCDLGVNNKSEWDNLLRTEQEKRINDYLEESESYIRAIVINW